MDTLSRDVAAIDGRLSLRKPQREALELLAKVTEALELSKRYDLEAALNTVQGIAPSVTDFDHGFPSLCFALATGVGKTRLMGAFIAYLYRVHELKHFFVLAPNLTVYEKLKADFTPNTPKYVFPGLGDVTEHLVLITGDDWQDGRGVRERDLYGDALHVNIFNVAKINSEVRGGAAPRMKRLYEVIGDSYFDYLSKLDDLVLMMDESHRYRAQAGAKAIEDLKPILGLELTATPQTVQGTRVRPFRNVAYNYPLANAIIDGLVKVPAVATRANFDAASFSGDELERLKLEDGMKLHEQTKAELAAYAAEHELPVVKPFVLVVAENTAHAESVKTLMEQATFCEGQYAGKITVVHSNQTGEIKDDNLQRLLNVESPDEPTEIVIHVNKLGEGWDVTNLYTLIPLRAANSPNLVEQSLGRGLRLPYGQRTGVEAVDQLTVVSHDKFQSIIDYAKREGSAVRTFKEVLIDEVTRTPLEVVTARPLIIEEVAASTAFKSDAERSFAQLAMSLAFDPASGLTSSHLATKAGAESLVNAVMERSATAQQTLGIDGEQVDAKRVVSSVIELVRERTIAIPRITITPKAGAQSFRPFTLDVSSVRRKPLPQEILVQALQSHEQHLVATGLRHTNGTAEDLIVRELAADSAIAYERHASLLYDLAGQMVKHLATYLDSDGVMNVAVTQGRDLAQIIREQMLANRDDTSVEYDVAISGDVHKPKDINGASAVGAEVLYFGNKVPDLSRIRLLWFAGFKRCLFGRQRFQSDAERRMAVILENDADETLKWYKPANGDLKNIWLPGGQAYNPDFIVETSTAKYLIEPKADDEMTADDVVQKADAARAWCGHASAWEQTVGGKPWRYLLVPDSAIKENSTLTGLEGRFG